MRWSVVVLVAASACGGKGANEPKSPHLEAKVESLVWYRSAQPCGQGPYDFEVATTGAKYGEDVELQLHAPHAIAIQAIVLADDHEVDRTTFGGKPDNTKCVASAHEQLGLARTGGTGSGSGGTPIATGTTVVTTTQTDPPRQLELETADVTDTTTVIHFHVPHLATPHVKIRVWSVDPNDLAGVRFGIAHVTWRPNVGEAAYEAWIADREAKERARFAAEQARAARQPPPPPRPEHIVVEKPRDYAAEQRARDEADRRRAIAAALEADRAARRKAFCAAHHDDRGCWGPGGYTLHAALDQHKLERDSYCMVHKDDARCWTDAEWSTHRAAWNQRVRVAREAPKQPDGPPPAPKDDPQPPRLSTHADWRPGYWQWTEGQWVWLAGMWRVPDADIANEDTTKAPAAPPPLQVEPAPPPPPVAALVWIAGYWQWGGTAWVWVPGNFQLRPSPAAVYRPAEWRARGTVHILIPGGWVAR